MLQMRKLALLILLISSFLTSSGQNLVGMNSSEIRKYMSENHKSMNFNSVVNSKYSYLKYTNNDETVTTLFFLDQNSVCTSMRIVCDLMIKGQKVKEMNGIYQNTGENTWIDKKNGMNYLVTLRSEKWSCTITIEPEKK